MNQLQDLLSVLTGIEMIISIVAFIVVSYLIVALLTWSFIKPLKYLSVPSMIVGILLLIIRFSLPSIIGLIPSNELSIPSTIIAPLLSPFLKTGIICLVTGILSLIIYIIINKLTKKVEVNKQETPLT